MMATRSHSRSASSIRCVVSTTVFPRWRMPRTRSQIARRGCGSRPVVNSSRNSNSGSLTSASAMNRRCFWLPDTVMNQASRLSLRSNCSSSRQPFSGFRIQRRLMKSTDFAHLMLLPAMRIPTLPAVPLLTCFQVSTGHRDPDREGAPRSSDDREDPRRNPTSWSCPETIGSAQAEYLSLPSRRTTRRARSITVCPSF